MKRKPQEIANFFECEIVVQKEYKQAFLQDGTREIQAAVGSFIDWDSVQINTWHVVKPHATCPVCGGKELIRKTQSGKHGWYWDKCPSCTGTINKE
ncbi:MAG: hypothetical protein H8D23_41155 [Candidatus Brocadiales bacterium]|nr:hypothetical protein [Candidatus Brocadiales bacterium]